MSPIEVIWWIGLPAILIVGLIWALRPEFQSWRDRRRLTHPPRTFDEQADDLRAACTDLREAVEAVLHPIFERAYAAIAARHATEPDLRAETVDRLAALIYPHLQPWKARDALVELVKLAKQEPKASYVQCAHLACKYPL